MIQKEMKYIHIMDIGIRQLQCRRKYIKILPLLLSIINDVRSLVKAFISMPQHLLCKYLSTH